MAKKRSKEEERARKQAYRERRQGGQASQASDVPAPSIVPTGPVPTHQLSPPTPDLSPPVVPPYSQRPWPVGMPFAFVPMWVLHDLPAPNANAAQAYEAHVAKTLRLTGRTPAANLALQEGR